MKEKPGSEALRRAEVIIRIRSGLLTATAGAARLGISRKSYYQWEARGLRGLLAGLECGPAGRPRKIQDPEKADLQRRIKRLEDRLAAVTAAGVPREDPAECLGKPRPAPPQPADHERRETREAAIRLWLDRFEAVRQGCPRRSAMALCQLLSLPYSTLRRWRSRQRAGLPILRRPGPAKPGAPHFGAALADHGRPNEILSSGGASR